MTISEWAEVYSPSTDNNNPVEKAKAIADRLGVSVMTPIGKLEDRINDFTQAVVFTEDSAVYNKLYGRQ